MQAAVGDRVRLRNYRYKAGPHGSACSAQLTQMSRESSDSTFVLRQKGPSVSWATFQEKAFSAWGSRSIVEFPSIFLLCQGA